MDELFSLKWNNHDVSFRYALKSLRDTEAYSDVTLVCDGIFYNAHKFVLSTCSEYFKEIFELTAENVLIVLADISPGDFEFLLDYMYIGQVNVHQLQLSSLLKAAKCLKIKGLAGAEEHYFHTISKPKKRKCSEEINTEIDKTPTLQDLDHSTANMNSKPKQRRYLSPSRIKKIDEDSSNSGLTENPPEPVNGHETEEINCNNNYQGTATFVENLNSNIENNEIYPHELEDYFDTGKTLNGMEMLQPESILETSPVETPNNRAAPQQCPCDYCGRVFTSPWYLNRHVMIHTGEKPYRCPHCSYRANQKQSVISHMKCRHLGSLSKPVFVDGRKHFNNNQNDIK